MANRRKDKIVGISEEYRNWLEQRDSFLDVLLKEQVNCLPRLIAEINRHTKRWDKLNTDGYEITEKPLKKTSMRSKP